MKQFIKKVKKWFSNFVAYTGAILVLIAAILIPITAIAWCVKFWIDLF